MTGLPNVSASDVRKGRASLRHMIARGTTPVQARSVYAELVADAVVADETPYGPHVYAYAVLLRWDDVRLARWAAEQSGGAR